MGLKRKRIQGMDSGNKFHDPRIVLLEIGLPRFFISPYLIEHHFRTHFPVAAVLAAGAPQFGIGVLKKNHLPFELPDKILLLVFGVDPVGLPVVKRQLQVLLIVRQFNLPRFGNGRRRVFPRNVGKDPDGFKHARLRIHFLYPERVIGIVADKDPGFDEDRRPFPADVGEKVRGTMVRVG